MLPKHVLWLWFWRRSLGRFHEALFWSWLWLTEAADAPFIWFMYNIGMFFGVLRTIATCAVGNLFFGVAFAVTQKLCTAAYMVAADSVEHFRFHRHCIHLNTCYLKKEYLNVDEKRETSWLSYGKGFTRAKTPEPLGSRPRPSLYRTPIMMRENFLPSYFDWTDISWSAQLSP